RGMAGWGGRGAGGGGRRAPPPRAGRGAARGRRGGARRRAGGSGGGGVPGPGDRGAGGRAARRLPPAGGGAARRGGGGGGDARGAVPGPEGEEPEAEALGRCLERDRLVAQACARARSRSREATWRTFWLAAVEGWESAAVAAELGLTLDAVYAAVCRGRRRLREELEGLGLGPRPGPMTEGGAR